MAVSSVKTKFVETAGGEIKPASPPVKGFQFAGGDPGSPQLPKEPGSPSSTPRMLSMVSQRIARLPVLFVCWLVGLV